MLPFYRYAHTVMLTIIIGASACNDHKPHSTSTVQDQSEAGSRVAKDYFEVTNEIYATIQDSVAASIHYDVNGIYCGPRGEERQLPRGSTFKKPFSYTNLSVQKNTDATYPSDLYWIRLINDSIIQIHYGVYCLPRIIYRGNPPPDNRPRPFLYIAFDCPIRTWQNITAKVFTEKQKSSTKTAYVSVYPYLPQNTSHKVVQWAYKSTVKVFKEGKIYREYEVSNKIPNLTKVHSSFSESEKRLLVEIIE